MDAYEILSNPGRKFIYDVFGDAYFEIAPDLLEFQASKLTPENEQRDQAREKQSSKGKDVLQKFSLSLRDLYNGKKLNVTIKRN